LILLALATVVSVTKLVSAESVSSPPIAEQHHRAPSKEKNASNSQTQQIAAVIQEGSYNHWWQSPNAPEWALFFLTVPYVLVSIGLLVVTGKAANAAKRSADALALTNRAFVLFDDRISPDPREKSELTYWLSNSGHTPAYIKIIWAHVGLGAPVSGGIPASLRDPSKSYKTATDIAVLGPQQTFNAAEPIGRSDYVDDSVQEQIRENQRALWFYGFVIYVDAFEREHVTEWCRFWNPMATILLKASGYSLINLVAT
jgi:hypothetical protein